MTSESPAEPQEIFVTLTYYGDEPAWQAESQRGAEFVRRWLNRYIATHPDGERVVEAQPASIGPQDEHSDGYIANAHANFLAESRQAPSPSPIGSVDEHARAVMFMLREYGGRIVPHLMDTDDNAGQYLRRALGITDDEWIANWPETGRNEQSVAGLNGSLQTDRVIILTIDDLRAMQAGAIEHGQTRIHPDANVRHFLKLAGLNGPSES